MIELKGKYNSCKIFTDVVDANTISHIMAFLNQECLAGSKIRIQADCHDGKGAVIGTTMTIKDTVIPNVVGVDIGCGMHTAKLKETRIEFPKLDSVIKKNIPSGGNIRTSAHKYASKLRLDELRCLGKTNCHVSIPVAEASIGTLGGGNHFIEVDKDKDGNKYLVVHTGSRRLGKDIAEYYQDIAYQELTNTGEKAKRLLKEKQEALIKEYKATGRQKELQEALSKLRIQKKHTDIPYELAYIKGSLFDDYIHDMEIAQEYAYWNRKAIIDTIVNEMKWHIVDEFETIHNYIDTKNMILRKGSISAQLGEKVLIPINMRDGSIIAIGKGNEDYNYSAPHGAGRLISRSVAKESIGMKEFKESMKGIYTTCVNRSTIDESPMAYKDINSIIENIHDTVDIVDIIKPVYNFKACEEED